LDELGGDESINLRYIYHAQDRRKKIPTLLKPARERDRLTERIMLLELKKQGRVLADDKTGTRVYEVQDPQQPGSYSRLYVHAVNGKPNGALSVREYQNGAVRSVLRTDRDRREKFVLFPNGAIQVESAWVVGTNRRSGERFGENGKLLSRWKDN